MSAAPTFGCAACDPDTTKTRLPLADLHEALWSGGIRALYQPMVRLDDAIPSCMDVQPRLAHRERGLLRPDAFVQAIESAGLGFALIREVVARAFVDWNGASLARLGMSLSLNVPLDVLLHPALLVWLDERRETAGIGANQIGIGLVGNRLVKDPDDLADAVAGLRGAGYKVAIKDIGFGNREAGRLLRLGFGWLSFDRSLVRDSRDDPARDEMLRSLMADANAAGVNVLANGVDDAECWARMRLVGAVRAQGDLIGPPMPAANILAWHAAWLASHAPG